MEQKAKDLRNLKKHRTKKSKKELFLYVLQQICLIISVLSLLVVVTGTFVWKSSSNTSYKDVYSISLEDTQTKTYEDSIFFNEILGSYVSDLLRYSVICSQLETNGVFDGKKVIDVTAYVNRYNGIPSEYITAKYYLEDLIKWAQYGFESTNVYMTGDEADSFLSKMRTVTSIDFLSGSYTGGKVSIFNSDLESITHVEDVSGNVWDSENSVRDDVSADIMTNQYLTIEGKNIENYVFSWDEYYTLCSNVINAAMDLNENYNTYLNLQDEFSYNNTNVFYCIKKTIGNKTEFYGNVEIPSTGNKKISEFFKNTYGKYIYYDPSNMTYETDTLIEEDTLRYIIKNYSYAYPDNVQIWIGVDTAYLANDLIAQGNETFSSFVPYYWKLIILSVICMIAYIVLLCILTSITGKEVSEDGTKRNILYKVDKIPTEIFFAAGVLFVVLAIVCINQSYSITWYMFTHAAFIPICVSVVFVIGILFSVLYYSFVRRLKVKSLWKDSIIKKSIFYCYDHVNILLRVLLPFGLYLFINWFILELGNSNISNVFMLMLILFNLAIGIVLYITARIRDTIILGIKKIRDGDFEHKISEKNLHGDNLVLAQAVNSIGEGIREAVASSMKDERMKTDLITNVSHDIKTPLTSIINYVELIKRENIDNDKVREYVEVLDNKSQRLKQLTDDLVEASKISSGNISLHFEKINLVELVNQTLGEFSEKFELKKLEPILSIDRNIMFIEADSRRIWRVIENLFNNICKYAMEGTRIYIDMYKVTKEEGTKQVVFSVKNISAQPLNINSEELTERFIRGDVARTTEGSGLGLSIAKSLTEAQKGKFDIILDGDLFKVMLTFMLLD